MSLSACVASCLINHTVHPTSTGYDKDAALIARDAIKHASSTGCDVVLVDTAGRMQV